MTNDQHQTAAAYNSSQQQQKTRTAIYKPPASTTDNKRRSTSRDGATAQQQSKAAMKFIPRKKRHAIVHDIVPSIVHSHAPSHTRLALTHTQSVPSHNTCLHCTTPPPPVCHRTSLPTLATQSTACTHHYPDAPLRTIVLRHTIAYATHHYDHTIVSCH